MIQVTRCTQSFLILGLLSFSCFSELTPEYADLVLRGGKIVTVNADQPEVSGLAVRGDRIVAMGSSAEVASFVGPNTEVIELDGLTAIPGLIEGHGHFMGIGQAQMELNLMHTQSWDEVVQMVAKAVSEAEPGQVITGRGWHQEKWNQAPEPNVGGLPSHAALSAVSPDNPVVLRHASGHAAAANKKAMEMSGIDEDTPDPEGGEIVRDSGGRPIGVFRETASGLLSPAFEDAKPLDQRRMAELAQAEVFAKGITSFQDAGISFKTADLYRDLIDEGRLRLRMWVMIRSSNEDLAENLGSYRLTGYGDDRLTVGGIKKSIDGALGSHGAWLLEPYADLPSSAGLNTVSVKEVIAAGELAIEHDYQLCIHAIGDRANREVLDIFEAAYKAHPEKTDLRWRVEHAQHLHPDDIPRFGELGVIASMQGVHCTSDAPWVEPRLGEQRAESGAYVWRRLLDTGAVVSNGTDAPVEDVNPLASFYASVCRRTESGDVFYGGQRMTRAEALESYTRSAAYAAFEEELKGTLEIGKLADITILSKDIMTVPEEEIRSAEVRYTIVGGEVVYENLD
ncbi:MAG: putative amidohydrolase YtcJ [Candidatus Paceibacteria bacterium]|jgi:predicted amidohydrolase YtcJ